MKKEHLFELSVDTYDNADAALLAIGNITASIQEDEARLNEQIQSLRAKYDDLVKGRLHAREILEEHLEKFCLVNKSDFDTVRFRELMHGKIGFRTTPPKVALLNRKYNWDTVVELLRKMRWGKDFIRTKEEPDKEAILTAAAAKEIDDSKLASVGVKIDQTDKFGYEIKWDTIQ